MKRLVWIGASVVIVVLGYAILAGMQKAKSKHVEQHVAKEPETGIGTYKIHALKLPNQLSFAGEQVPLHLPDIKERLDRELLINTYWQSSGLLMFKRANKYFPFIETILREEGVPDDFKYLAVIESGLANVVSPAKAKGFWQIMDYTGKEYGLEINTNVDERYDLEKSTRAACSYLKKAKEKFGSWTLAAASYNAGMNFIKEQLGRQLVTDYYNLLLGEEPERYLFRILAVKEILTRPKDYGFYLEDTDLYAAIPVNKVEIDTAIANLAVFAKEQGLNYKILKLHNPWLRENDLKNKSRKKYTLLLPEPTSYGL